jgi:hypothetical protein
VAETTDVLGAGAGPAGPPRFARFAWMAWMLSCWTPAGRHSITHRYVTGGQLTGTSEFLIRHAQWGLGSPNVLSNRQIVQSTRSFWNWFCHDGISPLCLRASCSTVDTAEPVLDFLSG